MLRATPAALVALALAACGGHGAGSPTDGPEGADGPRGPDAAGAIDAPAVDAYVPSPLLDDRPYDLFVPPGYSAGTPTPLVIMLHGYSASADLQEAYFRLRPAAEAEGFLYARPDGTKDNLGNRFWNATDACCNLGHADVDDVAYLTAVLDDIEASYTVDRKRVFVVGHSNGGFMAHRLACDRADRIAAIVSFAGATWADPSLCTPSRPVSMLQIHGTADAVILYNGGRSVGADGPYPAASTTAATWRRKNGCTGTAAAGRIDLAADVLGAETTVDRASGCPAGGAVELMSIQGGSHVPALSQPDFRDTVWGFFAAHPRP